MTPPREMRMATTQAKTGLLMKNFGIVCPQSWAVAPVEPAFDPPALWRWGVWPASL